MALKLNDRVKETSTTTGTGTLDLSGAVSGFETFVEGIADGNTTYYAIVNRDEDEWETGLGTVTDASTDTLARTTVFASSNSDSAVDFSAGTKDVFCTLPASKTVILDSSNNLTVGKGDAGVDYTLTFDGADADGVLTWMEDEDYFKFSDDILINSTERLNFRDTALYIYSSADGQLDLIADTEIQIAATTIDINGAVVLNGAITGATNITLSGELDAATLDISGNADIDGTLEADAITINGTGIGSIYQVLAGSSDTVTTGALNSGSITSGFGTIDTGSSTITTTGLISGGSLDIDNVLINGTTIGHTDDTDLLTLADGILTVAGEVSMTTLDIGGTNVTTTAAELNLIDGGTARGTTALADGDGILINDGGVMRMTNVTAVRTYMDAATLGANSVDSDNYVDGSIDNAHLADNAVNTQEIADNAITLAKLAGGTDGNIISFDASGDPVAIATGNDGQVLTSTGAGSPPAFEDAASGAVSAINNATANELVTIGSTTTELDAEANLTFDGTNLLIGGTGKIYFNDAGGEHISGSGSVLSIAGGSEIDLTATTVDLNGTLNVSGVATFQATPVFPDGSLALADLDIDGGTDIGAAIVDADLFIIDDGAGGTNRKVTASRIKTYAGGAATIGALTDVSMDITNFTNGLLIQTNSDGSAPTTGTLSSALANIGIGTDVFKTLTSGDYNVGIGNESMDALTTGSHNVAIGHDTLSGVVTGADNIAIGQSAGHAITSGGENILIGKQAGQNLTTNSSVVAIGANAMQGTGGVVYSTVMIGEDAGGVCDANSNTIVGHAAGDALDGTGCTTNSLFGDNAGGALIGGNGNTCIGSNAGDILTTGYLNTVLGKLSDPPASGSIGHFILGDSQITDLQCQDTSISGLSDERDKAEITNLPSEAGLSFINSLTPRTFYWDQREWYDDETPDGSKIKRTHRKWKPNSGKRMGFIAQEVQTAIDASGNIDYMNEIVSKENPDKLMFGPGYLMTPLVKAVQELSAENATLAARIKVLEDA